MSESFPRVTLFIPGTADSPAAWEAALGRQQLHLEGDALKCDGLGATMEVEWVENDGSFGAAFSFGTVAQDVVDAIDRAPVAMVLYCHVDLREGRQEVCSVMQRLRNAGALAVRLEQSKVGWEVGKWIELMESNEPWAWHRATVAFLRDEGVLQSCGMHAFSLPDVYVRSERDDQELDRFATALNVYQLAEDPVIVSGQTFAPDASTPRRVLERWPDVAYSRDHPCNNPYGVWRVGSAGSSGRLESEPAPTFVPALHAVLMALEKQVGAPLSQEQVEAARDGGACIAMKHRDAQQLERSRGYADLNPEFVWEQWCLVRNDG